MLVTAYCQPCQASGDEAAAGTDFEVRHRPGQIQRLQQPTFDHGLEHEFACSSGGAVIGKSSVRYAIGTKSCGMPGQCIQHARSAPPTGGSGFRSSWCGAVSKYC